MKKVIVRVKGGLGNQLFCYAAARRLALANDAELVIDGITGFARDRQYRRRYALDAFEITARKATFKERLEPFERYRRGLTKIWARSRPFFDRAYVEQAGNDFDPRLLQFAVRGTVYLDGYWQSEKYFKDVEDVIREDLRMRPPGDEENQATAALIGSKEAVSVHVRRFCSDNDPQALEANLDRNYYERAIRYMESRLSAPHYFVFSDVHEEAVRMLKIDHERVTWVSHNNTDEKAYADLWLMSRCSNFISANSTFSWWGAWLGACPGKIVVTPGSKVSSVSAWGFEGLIPRTWVVL